MAKASARSRSSKKSGRSAKKSPRKSARKAVRKSAAKSSARSARSARSTRSVQNPIALLFSDLENELATTRRMLERVPNGNNDWRPHTKSRTLGELATHLAQLPGFGVMMVTRDEFDGLAPRPPAPTFATTAERVRFFDEISGQLRNILRQMSWDQANTRWKLRLGDRVVYDAPRAQILRSAFVTHSAHHRAQLGVYLRMLEVPVPWSYGRTADEDLPPDL